MVRSWERQSLGYYKNRSQLYEQTKAARTARWSGAIRNWEPVEEVSLNARNCKRAKALAAAA